MDGQEITQFTYFQQVGGIELDPICAEITYGLERIAACIQGVNSVYDLKWKDDVTYNYVHKRSEREWSIYNFEVASVPMLLQQFSMYEEEGKRVAAERGLALPVYDMCLKCSHIFNLLNARNAISTTERQTYIARVRELAKLAATLYLEGSGKEG
jgi:glycyl-tRNA synthetase alpha chain